MAYMANSLIKEAGRLGAGDTASVANIIDGAQYGFGNHLPNIDAATPLVLRPVVPIVTGAPRMFDYLPRFTDVLKALIERHTQEFTGIDLQYTVEAGQIPSGPDGQMLGVPLNARRAPITPSAQMPEITGNLVWNFFRTWQRMMMDPDTQASSLAGVVPDGTVLDPHVMSMFSMDILFIQYDLTLQPQNIIDAYFVTGMWPTDIGQAGFQKNLTESRTMTRDITFRGVLQHNRATRVVGQNVATALGLHKYNYDFATPITDDIEARLQDAGLQREVSQIAADFVPTGGNAAVA